MPSTPVPATGSRGVPAWGEAAPGPAVGMGWRGDLVTAALAAWLVLGLFVDGWAHNTRPLLETFFTPWHALFYSGFAAVAAWVGWSVSRRRSRSTGAPPRGSPDPSGSTGAPPRGSPDPSGSTGAPPGGSPDRSGPTGGPPRGSPDPSGGVSWRAAVPPGYGLAVVGLALFLASGVGDMAWHLAFGIEQNIDALLSPTHLGLFLGALLVVTAPLRSAWADPASDRRAGLGRLLPAVLSATLAGVLVAFMFQYLHPVYENVVSLDHLDFLLGSFDAFQVGYVREVSVIAGIAGFLVATVTLFGPLVWLARHWRLPAGAALLALGVQVLLMQAVTGFADAGLAVLGVLGAAAVEGLVLLLRPGGSGSGAGDDGERWRVRVFALAAPAAFWGVYLAGIGLHDGGLGWAPELWGGALVWSSLTLLGLTALLLPPAAGGSGEARG